MDTFFSNEHLLFRESLRRFLNSEIVPHLDEWEEAGEIPREVFRRFGELGYFGIGFPEDWNGSGLDFFFQVILLEELGRLNSGGFAASILAHPTLALTHIAASGSKALKSKYLIPGIAGEKVGALAITEPGAGSDVANIKTRAIRRGNHYLLEGSKTFITNGVLSDFMVVAARTGGEGAQGLSILVVDREIPGLTATPLKKLGWQASDTGEIAFDGVEVPADHLLGEENTGFGLIMQRFALERLVMAITAIASCEAALEETLEYMRHRKAFGRNLNRFQVLRHHIAQLTAEVTCQKAFVYTLCQQYDNGVQNITGAAMAKLNATELSDRVMYRCLQMFGGYGYMEDFPLARRFRDSRLGTIGGGTSEIMREIISRAMLD